MNSALKPALIAVVAILALFGLAYLIEEYLIAK
jgi:hypothetical protein